MCLSDNDQMPFIVVIVLLVLGVITLAMIYWFVSRSTGRKKKSPRPGKDRETIIKQANRQLASNPKDHNALLRLADVYYDDQAWDKAMKTYGILIGLCATTNEIEEWYVTMRYALAALQLKNTEEAYKSLMVARTLKEDDFEINTNLGYLEHRRGNNERAVQLLNQAIKEQPEHVPTKRYLGRALHKLQRYKDAGAWPQRPGADDIQPSAARSGTGPAFGAVCRDAADVKAGGGESNPRFRTGAAPREDPGRCRAGVTVPSGGRLQ